MNIETEKNSTPALKSTILERLERDSVVPMPKIWFRSLEGLLWSVWIITILLGSVAFSVVEMVWLTRSQDIYEATHTSFLAFFFVVAPYVWLGTFGLMVALAFYQIRQTKSGYKYPFWQIILSSIVFSVMGGVLLHWSGVGMMVDKGLGQHMPVYMSQEKMELKLWQAPTEGRLVGSLVETGSEEVTFRDLEDYLWRFDISELKEEDKDRLFVGSKVRILGVPTTATDVFYACGVFPWLFDKTMPLKELAKERQDFIERMYAHKDEQTRLQALNEIAFEGRQEGRCAELPVIKRIGDSMQ